MLVSMWFQCYTSTGMSERWSATFSVEIYTMFTQLDEQYYPTTTTITTDSVPSRYTIDAKKVLQYRTLE